MRIIFGSVTSIPPDPIHNFLAAQRPLQPSARLYVPPPLLPRLPSRWDDRSGDRKPNSRPEASSFSKLGCSSMDPIIKTEFRTRRPRIRAVARRPRAPAVASAGMVVATSLRTPRTIQSNAAALVPAPRIPLASITSLGRQSTGIKRHCPGRMSSRGRRSAPGSRFRN
jgi:hypothetical protein